MATADPYGMTNKGTNNDNCDGNGNNSDSGSGKGDVVAGSQLVAVGEL
jgi:hypothetical protein